MATAWNMRMHLMNNGLLENRGDALEAHVAQAREAGDEIVVFSCGDFYDRPPCEPAVSDRSVTPNLSSMGCEAAYRLCSSG